MDVGQRTISPVRRKAVYKRLQEMLVEEAPWIFLCQTDETMMAQPWVKGARAHVLSMRRYNDVWLTKQEG
jgi:ABC-type transport system substrate-binding protein